MTPLLLRPPTNPVAGGEIAEDLRLRNDIERAIVATGHRCLRHVSVSVRGPIVTLRGLVPSYYLKQLAQCAALPLAGPRELQNEVTVFESGCGPG